jgi:hypothetical protein
LSAVLRPDSAKQLESLEQVAALFKSRPLGASFGVAEPSKSPGLELRVSSASEPLEVQLHGSVPAELFRRSALAPLLGWERAEVGVSTRQPRR